MSLTAALPLLGPRGAKARRRLGWAAAISLALHLAIGLALLLWPQPKQLPEPFGGEGVEVVFQPQEDGPPLPQTQQPVGAPPAAGAPAPLEAPEPDAPPLPSVPPPPPPPPMAAAPPPPAPPAPPVEQAAPPPPPAPPSEATAPPRPQPLALPPPPPQAPPDTVLLPPPTPQTQAEALPTPPPPAPPLPDFSAELSPPTPFRLQPQRQEAPPRPAPRPQAPERNPFAGTTQLGREATRPLASAPPRPRPAPGRPGTLDLALGSVPAPAMPRGAPAPGSSGSFSHLGGATPGQGWVRAFQSWVQRRGFYPPQAAQAGEDGTTVVDMEVARDGRILWARISDRSGSRWLDAASISLFRDQVGPAFTWEMQGETTQVRFTLHYHLIMR
ncbi:TonB family protein [Roseomonas sp. USHLN139]|uniref:TonB family protein n=1 Tax=Roseomonas sp. USHLN139 TaxID=3081298 RepID=UPI003B01A636